MPKSKTSQIIELPQPETESPENSENKIDNPSNKFISPKNQDLLTKIGIYSLNIGSRFLSETYKAQESIGNFYGALGFATLDVLLARKNSKFKRLTKFGGYLFYVGSCGYDLISGLNDWDNLWPHLGNFALDVTMAYQLGKDMGSLYNEESETEQDKPHSLRADLKSLWPFGKSKDKNENNDKNLESKVSKENVSEKKEDSKFKLKEHLSAFGKGIGQGVSYGALAGYSFGDSVFETLKEKYSAYQTKQKEKKEFKKIKNEEIKQKRAEQKIKTAGFEKVSIGKKKEILVYLDELGKNPNFMKNYEIENGYAEFKQKPVKEQIQIMTEKRNYFETNLKQMKSASWIKRFNNSSEISYAKSALKNLDKILFDLDVEEKNYPYQSQAITDFIKKREGEEKDGK